jgi:hypothetical protein
MENIFGEYYDCTIKATISSIGYDEQQIIANILSLHSKENKIDCDPTYSVGNFYKSGIPKPKYIFDKYPQPGLGTRVIQASANNLPLNDESINTIMFDPPFVIGGELHEGIKEGSSIIQKRFTGFNSFFELKQMYFLSLREFYRILKDNGIVIFKCQDQVSSAKQHFIHVWIMYKAMELGFYPKDLFILLSKNRLTDKRIQQHARKFHSYFWVFEKSLCKIDYI